MTEPTDATPLNVIDLMRVVMDADNETRGFALRGTTNWAAHIGRAVQNAVLAKLGTPPAVAGEPDYATFALWYADHIGDENKPVRDAALATYEAFAPQQPTQAQAGAVPLTDGQAKEVLWAEHLRWMRAAGLDTEGMRPTGEWLDHWLTYVRAIERAHGIGIKGGQHAE